MSALAMVFVVALAGVGVSQATGSSAGENANLGPVESCSLILIGDNQIHVEWRRVSGVSDYVVWNNGHQVAETTDGRRFFTNAESYAADKTQHYAVSSKVDGVLAPKTYCGKIVPEDFVIHPNDSTCSVEALADGTVAIMRTELNVEVWRNGVRWTAMGEEDGFLNVPGAIMGRDVDQYPLVGPVTYTMQNSNAGGGPVEGPIYTCGTVEADETAPMKPVAECSLQLLHDNRVEVIWDSSPRAMGYVIWNNGHQLADQAGRVRYHTSADPYAGDKTQHFAVSSKRGSNMARKTYCGKIDAEEFSSTPAQPECHVVVPEADGENFVVRWSALGSVEVVIRRSVDGAGPYWRGRNNYPFFDSYRTGDVEYSIEVRNADGTTGPAMTCSMQDGRDWPNGSPVVR